MTGGENRRRSILKALRKRRIDHDIHCCYYYRDTEKDPEAGYYKNLHQYSKNKIHCSCPMCASKTNRKRKGNYKISDIRKLQKLRHEE